MRITGGVLKETRFRAWSTSNSGHSDGVVKIADPGTVNVDVNKEAGEASGEKVPGTVNMDVNGESGDDPGSADMGNDKGSNGSGDVVTTGFDDMVHGVASGHDGERQGPGMVNVGVNKGSGDPGSVVYPGSGNGHLGGTSGGAEEDRGPGNLVSNGRFDDVKGTRDDNRASGGAGDVASSGQAGEHGVGAWPRRYTCGPTVGARPRRYTCGPTIRGSPRRDGIGQGADVQSRRRQPSSVSEATSSGGDPQSEADQSCEGDGSRPDDLAIAGDPMSTLRPVDRPRRAVRRPVRFRDFEL